MAKRLTLVRNDLTGEVIEYAVLIPGHGEEESNVGTIRLSLLTDDWIATYPDGTSAGVARTALDATQLLFERVES